ncbi:MAG: M20 family metallopeptidase [Syntrophobacteraceae bacterium]
MHRTMDSNTVDLLRELVSIPSVNPGFRTPDSPLEIFGEQKMGAFLAEFFERAGCKVWFDEVLPGRSNLIVLLAAGKSGRRIALQSHLDTVQITGMTVEPWGRRDGDRLYGRGSCDTKASTAAFARTIQYFAENTGLDADLYFLGTIDEEHGFAGSRHLGKHYQFDACFVGEPTNLQAVTAHKGSVRFELVAQGKSAHSSTPQLGHNALFEMCDLIRDFRAAFDRFTGGKHHPLTGSATWAPTMMSGGVGLNTIPEVCTVAVDRRLVPGEQVEDIIRFVDEWSEQCRLKGHQWLKGETFMMDPPFEADPESPPAKALRQALAEMGLDAEAKGVPYGTDATKIAAGGTPCVVFGPGDIAQAHKSDEWIHLPQVTLATEVMIEAVKRLDRILKE